MRTPIAVCLFLLLLTGCAAKAPEPVLFTPPTRPIDYLSEVKPLLDKRCVVCHSCYNSPCQLKLSSYEGVDRGASKERVYDGSRLASMDPTRLFHDAQSTEEWRQRGFFSVTGSTAQAAGKNNSLMLHLLDHKMKNPRSRGDYFSEDEDLSCAATSIELGSYLEKHPNRGMPFGFPPLTKEEFATIAGWLSQGGRGPTAAEQAALISPSQADAIEITKWEKFLNQGDAKHRLTARYLYEHLFLAHIKFHDNEYYELVRSATAAPERLRLINTVRPYDDPGVKRFYYRFRKIHSTIVHKTHMVFELNAEVMARFEELFIAPDWLEEPHLVGYKARMAANPFHAFEQIPPRSRYQFLLDNSHYILTTFIRGPVCKGQVALNVVNDHFWVMFLDPDHDLSLRYPALLRFQRDNLRMPIERGSDTRISDVVWKDNYRDAVVDYYRFRQDFYMIHNYEGLGYEAIWPGERQEDAPLLTVFRHFDSASVHRGALGDLPRTAWVIDYPLMERIYYALVAGFDVYGNVGHQLMVRKYMDALRVEGESAFLAFMPLARRQGMMANWNRGVRLKDLHYYVSGLPAKVDYKSNEHKREFVETLINSHLHLGCCNRLDQVNYEGEAGGCRQGPAEYHNIDDIMAGFCAAGRPGANLVRVFNDLNANLAYVRIRMGEGDDSGDEVVSIVINRWHDNVAVIFSEEKNLDPSRDRAVFLRGFVGSYPNYLFDVRREELPEFFNMLANFDEKGQGMAQLKRFGVNRGDADFWDHFDWFQKRFLEMEPVRGGLFDLNRYYYRAL
ncbi:MAG: fatty acid cis/trans isomerase [Thermodesulfobacteriota bacterium]